MDFALALPPDASSPPGPEDHPPPPPSATPSSAASASASASPSANGEPAHRESKRLRWTKPAYDPVQPAPPTFRLRDVGRQETPRRPTNDSSSPPPPPPPAAAASTAIRPPLPRLRTTTSVPTSWLRPNSKVNGKRKAYFDGAAANNRYTSLRELIIPTSPTLTDPPTASDASSSAAADHYDLQSPRYSHNHNQHHQQSISVHSIAIRNPLLKQAAYAYLRPTTPPAPEPKRSWLAGPRGHPDDDGHSCHGYCGDGAEAGGGLLCGGVGFVAGWVVGVVRCLFRRMFGRDAHAANKELGFDHGGNNTTTTTNGVWEQQQLEQDQQNHHQHQR